MIAPDPEPRDPHPLRVVLGLGGDRADAAHPALVRRIRRVSESAIAPNSVTAGRVSISASAMPNGHWASSFSSPYLAVAYSTPTRSPPSQLREHASRRVSGLGGYV